MTVKAFDLKVKDVWFGLEIEALSKKIVDGYVVIYFKGCSAVSVEGDAELQITRNK